MDVGEIEGVILLDGDTVIEPLVDGDSGGDCDTV